MNVVVVFAVALGTALATGLGVIPVMKVQVNEKRSIALSSAVAAGFMLGASGGLFYEGSQTGLSGTVVGAVIGIVFIYVSKTLLGRSTHAHVGDLRGARGATALLMIGVMTIHSMSEGIAVGVSFAGDDSLGILIAVAIAIHNIPEGVAISLTLIPFGERPRTAAAWSIFSSLPQPLMAVPAYLAVRTFEPLLAAGLGFAGGAMTWMVVTQLLPDALAPGTRPVAIGALIASTIAMVAFEVAIGF